MASADLIEDLTCSICMGLYTNPVALTCGHSFCRTCIKAMLDTWDRPGAYKCPECRAEFLECPTLEKNWKLCNIVERFQSTQPDPRDVRILCTYCIQFPVPAAQTCLLCEANLCGKHLSVHSKSAEHVLSEPTTSFGNKKCSVHKKVLEYYCCEDSACICVYCLAGEHRGHLAETLNDASEKKKEKLQDILPKLTSERDEAENRLQCLQKLKRQAQENSDWDTERVTVLIRDMKEQMDALEKRVLGEVSRQGEQVLLQVSDLMHQLEMKSRELSRKIGRIDELHEMTDPLTILQIQESDNFDPKEQDDEVTVTHYEKLFSLGDQNRSLISLILHEGVDEVASWVKRRFRDVKASDTLWDETGTSGVNVYVNKDSGVFLDINTASKAVSVSTDFKSVSGSEELNQSWPKTPGRFHYPQVLSSGIFSSGLHYWEVECSKSGGWMVGVAYPSVERKGHQSWLGNNNKSWSLCQWSNRYSVRHDHNETLLAQIPSCERLRLFLDYEAGRLSFYELCHPLRHLHTFNATFTEPLHAAFWVFPKSCVRIRS
uniref:Uncharacterized protein n=1 Tax=Leptobrachium leishanense TaxID=445787 RepID=A0A8C5M831_9ANUR